MKSIENDFKEILQEGITDIAKNAWNATGGKVVNGVVNGVKNAAKGVAGAAAAGGAMYLGAKQAGQDQENKNENQGEKQITDIGLGLDKQKYMQMAKMYNNDQGLKKALPEETKLINDINNILKTFNPKD
jgi:hypothetical protein